MYVEKTSIVEKVLDLFYTILYIFSLRHRGSERERVRINERLAELTKQESHENLTIAHNH